MIKFFSGFSIIIIKEYSNNVSKYEWGEFIEYVSDVSLENYKNKIIKNNGNILPLLI